MRRKLLCGIAAAVLVLAVAILFFLDDRVPRGRFAELDEGAAAGSPAALEDVAPGDATCAAAAAPTGEDTSTDGDSQLPSLEPLLRGRVLGEGQGIAGARVHFFSLGEIEKLLVRLERIAPEFASVPDVPHIVSVLRDELQRFRASAVKVASGEGGWFELHDADDGGHLVLTLAGGWLFRYGDVVSLERGRTAELTVELERGARIAGRVIGPRGEGMGGVKVIAEYRPPGMPGAGRIVRRLLRYVNGEFLKGPFESTTAPGGHFEIVSLPSGLYDLAAYDESGLESRLENVATGTTGAVIYFGPAASIEGYFADADGLPVPSVSVKVERQDALVMLPLPLAGFNDLATVVERYLGDGPRSAVSGPDGRFRVGALAAGTYRLSVEEPGLLPFSRTAGVEWGENLWLGTLPLDHGKTIRGAVRDRDGTGLGGARVLATPASPTFLTAGAVAKDVLTARLQTTTRADGAFVLSGLGRGPYRVTASRLGFQSATEDSVRPDEERVELVLARGKNMTGRVADARTGEPIAGARVQVGRSITRTSADGIFSLEGVAPSGGANPFSGLRGPGRRAGAGSGESAGEERSSRPLTLQVETGGFLREEVSLRYEELPPHVEVTLTPAPEIAGVVLTPAGDAAPAALVRLTPAIPDGMDLGFFDPSLIILGATVSDLEGKFTFRSYPAPPGRYTVIADHPLYARGRSSSFSFSGRLEDAGNLEVRLVEGATVRGTVTDGTAAVPGAEVRLAKAREERPGGEMFARMLGLPEGGDVRHSNSEGAFVYERVLPGAYTLSAVKAGFTDPERQELELGSGDLREVQFVLDPGGTIAGEVQDDLGEPLEGATVRVLREEGDDRLRSAQRVLGGSFRSAVTGEDGSFEVAGLPEGSYTVIAQLRSYTDAAVEGVAPDTGVPVLVLVPAAAIRGQVFDAASGAPVTSFRIELDRKGEEERRWRPGGAVTDPEGLFEREGLSPGEYTIRIAAAGFVPFESEARLAPAVLTEASFPLERAGRIRGRVVDAVDQRPIAGAQVALEKARQVEPEDVAERPVRGRIERAREGAGGAQDIGDAARQRAADDAALRRHFAGSMAGEWIPSGADGSFLLESVPEGPQAVVVTHPDYLQAVWPGLEVALGEEVEISVPLQRGLAIEGRTVDEAGRPAAGRLVFVRGSDASNGRVQKSATSGAGGEFAISGLGAGSYRILSPDRGGAAPEPLELYLEASRQDILLIIPAR